MTTRLAIVAAIPVIGVLLLLAGLYAVADDAATVRFEGRDYTGGATAVVPPGAAPVDARVEGRQVWVVRGRSDRIWLQRADGTFQVYRLEE